jgi:cystathionine beta-lyase
VSVDLTVPSLEILHQRRSEKWAPHPSGVLSATVAEMDFPLAPPVREVLQRALDRDDLGYPGPAPRSLRRAFAGFAARRLGWAVDEEQVSLAPDVMVGLVELCRALVRPGDVVALATPAYPPFFRMLPEAGVRLCELSLRSDGSLDLDQLGAALRAGARALVLASPHNPTGRALPRAELEAIAELCAEHEAWVLADEIHAPLTLDGATHSPWLEVSDAARQWGIALTSASKAFNLAGLKAALIVTAEPGARDLVGRMPPLHDHTGLLGVLAAEAAFNEGDKWLDAVLEQLAANRAQLDRDLARRLPGVSWRPPQATYLGWLDCTDLELGDEPHQPFLQLGGIALSRGLDFGRPGAGHVRLNFATSPEHLADAVARMARAVEQASAARVPRPPAARELRPAPASHARSTRWRR